MKKKILSKAVPVTKSLPIEVIDPERLKMEIHIDEDYLDSTMYLYIKKSNKIMFKFEGEIKDLPHCCGVFEFGDISTTNNFKDAPKGASIITDAFDKYFKEIFNHDGMKGKTLIINTVPTKDCKDLEQYLAECEYFTAVKQWKNNGNGNLITMWVSNNP